MAAEYMEAILTSTQDQIEITTKLKNNHPVHNQVKSSWKGVL